MRATIRDVAKESKVSRTTVSEVMHHGQHVKEETRQRVLKAIEKLRYNPQNNIPFLTKEKKRITTLGLVCPLNFDGLLDDYIRDCLVDFSTYMSIQGLLNVTYADGKMRDIIKQGFNTFRERVKADGLIFFSPQSPWKESVEILHSWGIPLVLIRRTSDNPEIPVITDDHYKGVQKALNLFHDLGHRTIAAVGRALDTNHKPRKDSFLSFMKEKQLAFDERHILNVEKASHDHSIPLWVKAIMNLHPRPTAIMCFGDNFAMLVIRELSKLGLRVPEDVAIIGYNNVKSCVKYNPSLTSVNIPTKEMVEMAVDILSNKIDGKEDKIENIVLNDELVIRESSGGKIG